MDIQDIWYKYIHLVLSTTHPTFHCTHQSKQITSNIHRPIPLLFSTILAPSNHKLKPSIPSNHHVRPIQTHLRQRRPRPRFHLKLQIHKHLDPAYLRPNHLPPHIRQRRPRRHGQLPLHTERPRRRPTEPHTQRQRPSLPRR